MKLKGGGALAYSSFIKYVVARFFLTLGIQMQGVALGWQVYELTYDPLALGLIGLTEAIPYILIAVFAGYWADKYPRKILILIALSIFVLCSLLLVFIASDVLALQTKQKLILLYATVVLTGIGRGVAGPSISALLPQLLPRHLYANGAAWNSSVWQIAAVSGPAIGGLLYGFVGKEAAFMVSAISSIIALVAYTTIPYIPVHKIALQPILKSLKEGFNFVYSQKIILGALSLDLMAVLFGGVTAILPMFVDEILNGGPQMLGILRAAPSLGAIITAIIVTRKAPLRHSGRILYLFIALYGVCILLFGLSRSFFACFICLLLSGAFDNVSVLIRSTIMQLMTPDHIRGRVASINGIFIGSSNEIGAFESGLAARLLGLIPSIIFGGFMTLGIVTTLYNVFPALRKLSLEDYIEKDKLM